MTVVVGTTSQGVYHQAAVVSQAGVVAHSAFSIETYNHGILRLLIKDCQHFGHFVLAHSAALLESSGKVGYHTTHLAVAV